MALEIGIAELVREFIAAGRPSSRDKSIDERRAGYIASTVLAGETETRVNVEDVHLDGMAFRVISRLRQPAHCQRLSITTAAALSAASLPPMTTSYASSLFIAAVG
jgi:hypothetical protein